MENFDDFLGRTLVAFVYLSVCKKSTNEPNTTNLPTSERASQKSIVKKCIQTKTKRHDSVSALKLSAPVNRNQKLLDWTLLSN